MRYGQIERRILDYMFKGGQDTLEGIVHWWMLEQKINNETAKVKEALDHLLAEGLVVELKGKDSRTHYRLNPLYGDAFLQRQTQSPIQKILLKRSYLCGL
jgi:hypothetical protein